MLRQAVGEAATAHLQALAWGRDPRRVEPERVEKSVSAETTFDVDVGDVDVLRRTLLALANRVAARLRAAGYAGRTVAIKVRLADFQTLSRSRTLPRATDVAREVFDIAWALFRALAPGDKIRLLGVRVEGLGGADEARQLELGQRESGWREAERAADAAAARFGASVIRPASLISRVKQPAGSDGAPVQASTEPAH
jgi:DNA polymerase-4